MSRPKVSSRRSSRTSIVTASRARLRCDTRAAIPGGTAGVASDTPRGSGDASNRTEDEPYVRNHRSPTRPGGETTSERARAAPWHASLALGFARRDGGTVLGRRAHCGPLRIQKPLFPEGAAVCHAVVLHPSGGIAGGDVLDLAVDAAQGAHALLTTAGALYIGWEALCFGRTASGERFSRGRVALRTTIERNGRPLWHERAIIDGGSPWLSARAGLAGRPVCATLVAAGRAVAREVVDACRAAPVPMGVDTGVTALPDVLLARCVAPDTERATMWFAALWAALRPALAGRAAIPLRVWNT